MSVGVYDNDHAVAKVIQLVVMSFDVTEIIDGKKGCLKPWCQFLAV